MPLLTTGRPILAAGSVPDEGRSTSSSHPSALGARLRDQMPGTHSERSGVGQRISAAKKGKPAVTRDPDVATLQQSVAETRLSRKVLLEAMERQTRFERGEASRRGVRHWRVLANHGVARLCSREERDEDLVHPDNRCQFCDAPGPGNSQLCRRHQAKKYPTVELVCDWEECPRGGEPFMRYGSVHHYRSERGDEHSFCSYSCRFAWQLANDLVSSHAPFDADSARQYHEVLKPQFDEARAELGLPLDVLHIAEATHTSPAVIRAHAPELGGKVIVIGPRAREAGVGAEQLAFPENAPRNYLHHRALQEREANKSRGPDYLDPGHSVKQQQRTRRSLLNKGLSEHDTDTIIKQRAEARRSLIRRHTGRPKRIDLSEQLLTFAEEALEECPDLSLNEVLAAAGLRSWQENAADWPRDRYPAAHRDQGSYDPKMRKNVVERVRFLVRPEIGKALLFAASKPRRHLS
jgi:hypothetical protein